MTLINPESEYENLKRRLEESCDRDEAQQKAIQAKRAEKRAIKKAGGGHAIAKKMLAKTKKKPSNQLKLQFE